ncbi:hypothetical protein FQN54_006984 [Arachnomyces sp. PD_36]|nr:hypothetical protein FQN54_006984 [Arachnomyces sp. PD_36]
MRFPSYILVFPALLATCLAAVIGTNLAASLEDSILQKRANGVEARADGGPPPSDPPFEFVNPADLTNPPDPVTHPDPNSPPDLPSFPPLPELPNPDNLGSPSDLNNPAELANPDNTPQPPDPDPPTPDPPTPDPPAPSRPMVNVDPSRFKGKFSCTIVPKADLDRTGFEKLESYLSDINKGRLGSYVSLVSRKFLWWFLKQITAAELRQILNLEGVEYTFLQQSYHDKTRKRSDFESSFDNVTELGNLPMLDKRAGRVTYEAQLDAPDDLRLISVPENAESQDPADWPEYVYEKAAGEGIRIYHIDHGVDLRKEELKKELPPGNVVLERIETPSSMSKNIRYGSTSLSSSYHSTCVASKAVGRTFGSAKKASLVPIDVGGMNQETIVEGIEAAWVDISQKKLQGKAVVLVTKSSMYTARVLWDSHPQFAKALYEAMNAVLKLGVPIVVPAADLGNKKTDDGKLRVDIDALPSTMATRIPIIVVGNIGKNGELNAKSQRGDLLTTNAMGSDILCLEEKGAVEKKGRHGSAAYAAGLVAGHVATLLSRKDASNDARRHGIKFVEGIRDYIRDKDFIKNPQGNKVLRNRVSEESYEKARKKAKENEECE